MDAKITQANLAKALGMRRNILSAIENEDPPFDTLLDQTIVERLRAAFSELSAAKAAA